MGVNGRGWTLVMYGTQDPERTGRGDGRCAYQDFEPRAWGPDIVFLTTGQEQEEEG